MLGMGNRQGRNHGNDKAPLGGWPGSIGWGLYVKVASEVQMVAYEGCIRGLYLGLYQRVVSENCTRGL